MKLMFYMRYIGALGVVASLFGCGEAHEETPGEEACEHLIDGPVMKVDAGATKDAPASASMAHVRYDLTFSAGNPDIVGFVAVSIEDAGEYLFYFDEVVGLAAEGASGAVEPMAVGETDIDCEVAKKHYTFDLEVGTYVFELQPETTTPSMVFFGTDHTHNH